MIVVVVVVVIFSFLVFVIYLWYFYVAYKQDLLIQRASRNAQAMAAILKAYLVVILYLSWPEGVLRESLIQVIKERTIGVSVSFEELAMVTKIIKNMQE